ncbi:hypothetical protein AB1Y20_021794, partial [Prymnesium parvum]
MLTPSATPRRAESDVYPPSRIPREGSLLFRGVGNSPAMISPAHVPFTTDRVGSSRASLDGNSFQSALSPAAPLPPLFSPSTGMGGRAHTQTQLPPSQPHPPPSKTPSGPPTDSIVDSMLGMAFTPAPKEEEEATPRLPDASHRGGEAGDTSGYWITAFGFHTAAMVPAVLHELRPSGGDFVQHRLGAGTWIHVQLRSRTDQMEALAKNGRVLNGFMLGVVEGIVPSSQTLNLN